MLISMATIYVSDQQKARNYYVDVLGFSVHTDETFGDRRWLTLSNPGGGMQLQLEAAAGPSEDFRSAQFDAGSPATVFISADLDTEHSELVKRGVRFTTAPTKMEYGGYNAVFDDTCGNLICLHQLDS